jgi:alpha-galactosidase
MGWDTWCSLGRCGRDYCDEGEVKEIADAMADNGMKDVGFEYINLADCWADHRDANGELVPAKNRFPNGIASLADYVNSKGFKLGIYTDAGLYTCNQGERDYKIPGSYGHYEQDAKTFANWGVEYVKMDWCNTKINGTQLDPHVQYKQMSEALKNTGKEIFFNSCEWGVDNPWEWMYQYANSWRTGPDHFDNWKSTASIIERNANLGQYSSPDKGWNDPDYIMTGGEGCTPPVNQSHCPGMTDVEYRTEFSIWCLLAAPLLVVTDVRNMTDIMKEILLNKEIINVNQDPLGYGGRRIGYDKSCGESVCQIWSKDLQGGYKAIGLYNADSSAHNITVEFSMFNWTTVNMRDLWQHKDIMNVQSKYTVEVQAHGTEVYKLSKVN